MGLGFFLCQEKTGGFHNVFGVNLVPFQVGRIFFRRNPDGLAVHHKCIVLHLDRTPELSVHGVVTKHICHIIHTYQVIDTDDLYVFSLLGGPENQAADTAKAVNSYFNLIHICVLFLNPEQS